MNIYVHCTTAIACTYPPNSIIFVNQQHLAFCEIYKETSRGSLLNQVVHQFEEKCTIFIHQFEEKCTIFPLHTKNGKIWFFIPSK